MVNGKGEVMSITLDKDVVDPNDVEMLQDLITAAVNDGVHRIQEAAAERMNRVTGGLRISGHHGLTWPQSSSRSRGSSRHCRDYPALGPRPPSG